MKKIYTRPEADVIIVGSEDIILLSYETPFVPAGMDENEE